MELNSLLIKTKNTIMQGCQSGQISVKDYSATLKQILDKDISIVKYLTLHKEKSGVQAKIQICQKRYKIVKGEYEEMQ